MTEPDATRRRWEQVDRIFDQALDLPAGERASFLARACASDPELLREVSELLDAAERTSEALLGPPGSLLRAALGTDETQPKAEHGEHLEAGARVGRYRLIGELGRGGQATVYEAERVDGAFEQTVAIKVLTRGFDSEEVVRRFLAERQILSDLAHPHIARLLDGGSTEDGRPFLVVEKVIGQPITTWADRRRLTVDQRLDLFAQVAEAVAFAHARLVVHRDLKPGNVLVSEDGQVKLLDFGIAKLLETDGDATATATRLMTPRYAAPEQILGQRVTTVADVHALGVVLYELLTGHRPFGDTTTSDFELQRAICEQDPPRPSSVVNATVERTKEKDSEGVRLTPDTVAQARSSRPERLSRRLRGDLDAVISKALRKEPELRYATVQELRDDLRRFRTGFPVRAASGAWAYRTRKFVRRNWLGVGSAAALMTVLAGASILLSIQQQATTRERDRATREAENGRLVINFLADVFRGRDPTQAPPDTITARELLAWGTERVHAEFGDQPEVQAELLTVMANAHSNLGLLEDAEALHERSVALRRTLYGDVSDQVADALRSQAQALVDARDFAAALPLRREALAIRRATEGPRSRAAGNALAGVGVVYRDLGAADSAEIMLRDAVDILSAYADADSSAESDYTAALLNLAYVLRVSGDLSEAEALYEEGIEKYAQLNGLTDPELPVHMNNLAYLKRVLEKYDEAAAIYGEALDLYADRMGRGHPTSLLLGSNMAAALGLSGRYEQADDILRQNVEAAETQWPDGDWRVGNAYLSLGRALLRHGHAADAEAPLDAGVRSFTQELGPGHNWTAFAMAARAVCYVLIGREEEGRSLLDRFYTGLAALAGQPGGLESGLRDQLQTLLFLLDDTGLTDYAERFRALGGDAGG